LPLERAERAELSLGIDDALDGVGAEGADQLVLQVGDAHEEPERLQVGAEPGAFEGPPEVGFLAGVAQAGQPEVAAEGAVSGDVRPDVRGAAHRHDGDVFGSQVPATAPGQRFDGRLVADALDQDHGSRVTHEPSLAPNLERIISFYGLYRLHGFSRDARHPGGCAP
jgi:hypothetical protein